jgi:GT2 family glycosyltransferase
VIDIVIVNWHGADEVAGALAALGDWRGRGTVWLVDNSTDAAQAAALQALADARGDCRVRVSDSNLGFGAGCHLAWAASNAPRVLLLNPDARIAAAEVDTLAAALDADARLAAVSPRTWWDAARGFVLPPPSAQGPWPALLPWRLALRPGGAARWAAAQVQAERVAAAAPAVRPVEMLAGALLLLRRSAVEAAGGLFDPRFFMFFEDADLSRRLRRAGHRLALVQQAQAVHGWRAAPHKEALMAASCHAYFEKHHPAFHRLSGRLARLQVPPAWAPDVAAGTAEMPLGPGRGPAVLAFSPSPLGWPALLRPQGAEPRPFSAEEWALLAPGRYVALLADNGPGGAGRAGGSGRRPRWVRFDKPAAGAPGAPAVQP